MKYKYSLLLGLSFVVCLSSCKKDKDKDNDSTTVVAVDNPNDTGSNANNDTTVTETPIVFTVLVNDFENTNGVLQFALYNTEVNYDDEQNPYIGETIDISSTTMQLEFNNVPSGEYAIAVLHDEDENGELNTNLFGAPTEGYGFSNNPGVTLGKPSFSDVSFLIDGEIDETVSVDMIYIF